MKKIYITLLIALGISTVNAEELFQAKSGQTISATISKNDLTRVQVSGFPIVKAYTAKSIKVKKDAASGQLFILPSKHTKTFSLFIMDSNGDTFNLYLKPEKNKIGDSIVIMPDIASVKRYKKDQLNKNISTKQSPYARTILDLIQDMYLGLNEDSGISYSVSSMNTNIPLYSDLNIMFTTQYGNDYLEGDVFRVTNVGKEQLTLSESDFSNKGVLAVSIENPVLNVNEYTRVFVVKEINGN